MFYYINIVSEHLQTYELWVFLKIVLFSTRFHDLSIKLF